MKFHFFIIVVERFGNLDENYQCMRVDIYIVLLSLSPD